MSPHVTYSEDKELTEREKMVSDRIALNISGAIYETRLQTLERYPQTLLGNHEKRLFYYCTSSKQYFFERSRLFFDSILFFYQSNGILQCPDHIPVDLFEEECRFFQMPEYAIDSLRLRHDGIFKEEEPEETMYDNSTIRMKLWNFLQNPETSRAAKYFAIFSLLMIILSVATSCLETLPEIRSLKYSLETNRWSQLELTLNLWFLLELITCATCAPNRMKFFKEAMTWFDMVAVLPYFIVLTFSSPASSSLGFLRIARLVRVGRLLRLSKHSVRIKIAVRVIKSSAPELRALLLCIFIVVILGGTVMYYIEAMGGGGHFSDVTLGMYWGVQTITTVGYGDIHPQTPEGMVFAAAFMTFGAMTLTIPVLTIITKFVAAYEGKVTTSRERNFEERTKK